MGGRHPSRRIALALLALTAVIPCASADEAPATAIAAVPLVSLAGPKASIDAWKKQLCAGGDLACAADPSRLALYRASGDPSGTVWGILATGPILVKLVPGHGSALTVQHLWDFSTYTHSKQAWGIPAGDPAPPNTLYPALYPAGAHDWAVAVVHHVDEGYSGGGADFAIADFVVLSDAPAGAAHPLSPLYAGVPFSCSKLIRACFTPEDYRRKGKNCHDEYSGILTLKVSPSPSPDRYTWTAVWHEEDDGSRQELTLPATGGDVWCSASSRFTLCQGGPTATGEDDPCSSASGPRPSPPSR
jgi:hypothetical protein